MRGRQNPRLTSEFIVNVDDLQDLAAWGAAANTTRGFITLLVSPNVHELRGYNRGAAVAQGDALIFLQDDDVPTGSCAWLSNLTALLAAQPRIGAVALKKACIVEQANCEWAWARNAVKYSDPATGLEYQYVTVADFSPLVVRATAFADVGGCDEVRSPTAAATSKGHKTDAARAQGGAPSGESGIMMDYELSMRMWAAGWHVAQLRVPSLKGGGGLKGGTSHGISVRASARSAGVAVRSRLARCSWRCGTRMGG